MKTNGAELLRDRPVLVANLSAPEVTRLGVELDRRRLLRCYVRPYVNRRRWWERAIERLPPVRGMYRQTIGRRALPIGMDPDRIVEAGVGCDLLAAAVGRLPMIDLQWRRARSSALMFAAERAVARRAGKLSAGAEVVLASYGTGRDAFEAVKRAGGRAVLNYPIAHNGFQARFYAEEAEHAPEFAGALPRVDLLPREYSDRLEAECELADTVLVGSTFVRRSFIEMGIAAEKIAVVPYGVDSGRFTPRADARRDGIFRALFVGQLGQRKGLSYLLEGYRRFQRPDTELQLVGSFASEERVYGRYHGLYRHTPHVPQSELPALYQGADVFVFPSLIEGMPLVVLEAMSCGLPVITTTHGACDIVRDGVDGFFVPIRDPDAIAARLEQLRQDPVLRHRLGENARRQALRFTWEQYSRSAADVIERGVSQVAFAGCSMPARRLSDVCPATSLGVGIESLQ